MNRPSDPSPPPLNSHELPPPTVDGTDIANLKVESLHTTANLPKSNPSGIQQSFKRLYVILLLIGLSLGGVAAIGVLNLLNNWGLTEPPPPVEETNR